MSELQIILTILAAGCLLWQLLLVALGAAMWRSGNVRNVRVGIAPGILAIILSIVVVLL